jgi:transcriptional regulator with XRE-family HTH domain
MAELALRFVGKMRVLRGELNLSQEELGARLGTDRVNVSRIERTAPNLSIAKAVAIAAALDSSVFAMVGGETGDKTAKPVKKTAQQITEGFARRVRELRAGSDLNQKQLSEKLGVDRNWVSAVESGKLNITFLTIEKFADALGVSPLEFL